METRRSWMDRETGPVLFQAHICPRNTFGKFGAKKYTTKTEDRWSKERETEIHFCAPIKDQLGRFRTSKYAFFTKAHYKQVLWLENEVKLSALLGKYGRQTNKSTDRPTTNQRTGYGISVHVQERSLQGLHSIWTIDLWNSSTNNRYIYTAIQNTVMK